MKKRRTTSNWLAIVIIALISAIFSVIDCASSPLLESSGVDTAVEVIVYGVAIAQINLLAIWITLAPANIVQRFSWALLLTVWTWYSYTVGLCWWEDWFGLRGPMRSLQHAIVLAYTLLIGLAAAVVPLWIVGNVLHWKIVSGNNPAGTARSQFSLRHLLWAMAVTALTIVPGRFILPPEGSQVIKFDGEMAFILTVLSIANLFITIPALWLAFSDRWWSVLKVPVGLVCCSIVAMAEFRAAIFEWGPPPDDAIYYYFLFVLQNATQFGIIYGTLWLFHMIGFQFVKLPSGEQPAALEPPVPE